MIRDGKMLKTKGGKKLHTRVLHCISWHYEKSVGAARELLKLRFLFPVHFPPRSERGAYENSRAASVPDTVCISL